MSETMTLVEKVARAMCIAWQVNTCNSQNPDASWWEGWQPEARAALRALGVTEEIMQGPADAVVVVPVEPDARMEWAASRHWSLPTWSENHRTSIYRAMLAHRPGAPE